MSIVSNPLVRRGLGAAAVAVLVAACNSGATPAPSVATPTIQPASQPAASVAGGPVVVAVANGILVGPTGMALYTHSGDSATSSTCTGGCLSAWPALTGSAATGAAGVSGTFGTLTRTDDGSTQITYNGKPLYYFASDSTPGQATGDGVGGFSVAKP